MSEHVSNTPQVFDKRITVGNIITILSVIASVIITLAIYKTTVDQHTAQLQAIEQNQKILEGRITLLEREMETKQTKLDKMQSDLNRTVAYLQLLLNKNGIHYVE